MVNGIFSLSKSLQGELLRPKINPQNCSGKRQRYELWVVGGELGKVGEIIRNKE